MNMIDNLDYDIEQLYIEGLSNRAIAQQLEIPVDMVQAWVDCNVGVTQSDEFGPYSTINS